MGERQFGPYKLIRQVAVGGMAEIHLAKTAGIAGFEKYVAIKMIHPNFAEDDQFIQMLVDEAKIAVQLTHGNIAQTFDLGRVGDTYYITMEYVDGADLYKLLRRASEQDLEMPLDVCAFVGKEISSALDHAHRKRDHTGKSLGIVHRDVSPQNVLVSYSGEVKLVDFGIAKATMKARQTAVGVIKGKYYYMSPEQAWGDPIDHRSDIFSAGIVLYEMITGQMLYLEEDLHKLLEMARAADIAPPSKLRRGVPPQLERIVMNALAKAPGDRYQSAGDFATDLERFLHAYSPVFTTSKLSGLLRQVIGEPMQVPDEVPFENIEFRDGVMSTHPLDDAEVAHAIDREELRDENSVIFRVTDLERPEPAPPAPPRPMVAQPRSPRPGTPPPTPTSTRPTTPSKPLKQVAPRVTRATDSLPAAPPRPAAAKSPSGIPSGIPSNIPSIARPPAGAKPPPAAKPRQPHEDTRQLETAAPPNPLHDDSSGLLVLDGPDGQKPWSDAGGGDDDLDNIGERTLVTAVPGLGGASTASPGGLAGFMMDVAGDDGDGPVEATLITTVPGFGGGEPEHDPEDPSSDDVPTLSGREMLTAAAPDPAPRPTRKPKAPPPAALSAKIHAPAISELRKPRASRRTPPGGTPVATPNVLHAIVSAQASEPMPAPRAAPAQPPSLPPPPPSPPASQPYAAQDAPQPYPYGAPQFPSSHHPSQPQAAQAYSSAPYGMQSHPSQTYGAQHPSSMPQGPHTPTDPYAAQFPVGTPGGQAPYHADASGLPMTMPTSPGMPAQQAPGVPSHLQPYLHMQGMPPGGAGYDPQHVSNQMSAHGYPQLSPGALYQFQPSQQPMSITGQMRLFEVDELPSQYKLNSATRRWFTYMISGVLAVSVAAAVTFLIIRSTREAPPTVGSVRVESVPSGADVLYDGTRLTAKTPVTIDSAPVGTRHTIRIELSHRLPYEETIDIPKAGGVVPVTAQLQGVTGKILVNSAPAGAEIRINGTLKGRTPATIGDLDPEGTVHIELRLKDYQPYVKDYQWPSDGKISIDQTLVKTAAK